MQNGMVNDNNNNDNDNDDNDDDDDVFKNKYNG